MNLTIKTLKGGKFAIEVDPSQKIGEVKGIVSATKPEFPAENMKLIHSGKVLKDDVTVGECNIKPSDFLVCMVTKPKKSPAPPAASTTTETSNNSTATPATASSSTATATATSSESTTATTAPPSTSTTTEGTTRASSSTSAPSTSATTTSTPSTTQDEFPSEVVSNLTSMGFPEAEVRACLRASGGNPDVAVEYLMNGIPPSASATSQMPLSASSTDPLEALRNHPQFNSLRQLVQSNPSMLQAVLTQIGQQQPELLQAINANQAAFLQMMNEPISDSTPPSRPTEPPRANPANPMGALQGMANPAQMAQMISNLSPTELNEMATMMGVSPQQLTEMAQMIGQIGSQEQFQDYMMQAMQEGGSNGGGGAGGAQILRLTEEEMAAVDRLTEMGFDRTEAAQAFLACDKNEALAANLLMDSADGFGFGAAPGGGNNGGNSGNDGAADDSDDMYD